MIVHTDQVELELHYTQSEVVWESYREANSLDNKAQNVGKALVLTSRVLGIQRRKQLQGQVRTAQTISF